MSGSEPAPDRPDAQLSSTPCALETVDLSKSFGGIKAVDRLMLAIRRGGMTSIVGPNGSGKSTLINIVTGMLPFDEGTVIINGIGCKVILPFEISSFGLTRSFQEVRLFGQMTVLDNVLLALTSCKVLPLSYSKGPLCATKSKHVASWTSWVLPKRGMRWQ